MPKSATDRLFMWAGGKTKMLSHYRPLLPQNASDRWLYEPFAGGAALFNTLASQGPISASLSDVNGEIIRLYQLVRDDPDFLIEEMHRHEATWLPLDKAGRKDRYYRLREE